MRPGFLSTVALLAIKGIVGVAANDSESNNRAENTYDTFAAIFLGGCGAMCIAHTIFLMCPRPETPQLAAVLERDDEEEQQDDDDTENEDLYPDDDDENEDLDPDDVDEEEIGIDQIHFPRARYQR